MSNLGLTKSDRQLFKKMSSKDANASDIRSIKITSGKKKSRVVDEVILWELTEAASLN